MRQPILRFMVDTCRDMMCVQFEEEGRVPRMLLLGNRFSLFGCFCLFLTACMYAMFNIAFFITAQFRSCFYLQVLKFELVLLLTVFTS